MQKNRFHFLIAVLILSLGFAFLLITNVSAVALNVDYPTTPAGSNITPQSTVPQYLKYVFDIGMFVGGIALFFSLAVAGVYYFLSPAIPSMRAKAKDQVFGAFSGFLVLLLVYLIITTINPNLSFFNLSPLSPNAPIPAPQNPPAPGAYFYQTSDCSKPPDPLIQANSTYDLKNFKRKTQSAKIVQDSIGGNSYISILFESPNFEGRCFYLDPNKSCNQNITPFASSASVYRYNFYPASGGVTFYREPFYNSNGGSFQVSGAQTGTIYFEALKDLNYMSNSNGNINNPDDCSVPKEKMDCVAWDDTGVCTKRKCPDLAGGNIGSIKISGNYVVLLAYIDPSTEGPKTSWSLCQSFPEPDDIIRMGPNKIKWEDISNQNRLPNYVVIFPVIDNTNPETQGPQL